MDEEYRSNIRKKISGIQNVIDVLETGYKDAVEQYVSEMAEVDRKYLAGNIGSETVPPMLDQWRRWFYEFSSKRGQQVGEVLAEISDIITTADNPEKKKILYEELENVWKLKKRKK